MTDVMRIARIAPHLWEEPCLSGQGTEAPVRGSGTVFFVGCSLHCIYCQNSKISGYASDAGRGYSAPELATELLRLQSERVHNINFVTPTHFSPGVIESVEIARRNGLTIPVVYNSSGYETVSAVESLSGTVDIFMPDFKYFSPHLAEQYSRVSDYRDVCRTAIRAMQSITGAPEFDRNGFLRRGTIVRHLVLPGSDADSRKIIDALYSDFGTDGIILSLMSQYTPMPGVPFPELSETLPRSAYLRVLEFAQKLGFRYIYSQDGGSASESFIPEFGKSY